MTIKTDQADRRHRRKTVIKIAGALVLSGCLIGFWVLYSLNAPESEAEDGKESLGEANEPKAVMPANARPPAGNRLVTNGASRVGAEFAENKRRRLPQENRELEKLHALLDADRESEAFDLARELMSSEDESVRLEVVETFGWLGKSAFSELTRLLGDKSEEVADDALTQWLFIADDIEDAAQLAPILNAAMQVVPESRLREVSMLYNKLPDDVAIRHLAELIPSAPPVVADLAREQYEFITGEQFTSAQGVEAWIKENVK